MDLAAQIQAIEPAILTWLVRQASGRPTIEVVDWNWQRLHGGVQSGGVFRLQGTGRRVNLLEPWSLILKVLPAGPASDDQSYGVYWKREALAYQSRLLDCLSGGLGAPRCFGVTEHPDSVWIWLEDMSCPNEEPWELDRYALVARHLGRSQAVYLTTRPLPVEPWLSRKIVRFEIERMACSLEGLANRRDDPAIRRYWPGATLDRVLRLRDARGQFLDTLERLPQTLGHGDFHRGNLFQRTLGDGSLATVAIDWAGIGIMHLARDLTHLVGASVGLFWVELDQLRELSDLALENYILGLRDGEWRGSEALVRFAFTADLGLMGSLLAQGATPIAPEQRLRQEQAWGHPFEELLERTAFMRNHCLDLADKAWEILTQRVV